MANSRTPKVTGARRKFEYEQVHENESGADRALKVQYKTPMPFGTAILVKVDKNPPTDDTGSTTLNAKTPSTSVKLKAGEKLWGRLEPALPENTLNVDW